MMVGAEGYFFFKGINSLGVASGMNTPEAKAASLYFGDMHMYI